MVTVTRDPLPIAKLQSGPQTSVKICAMEVSSAIKPALGTVVTDFACLREVNMKVNVRGHLQQLGNVMYSKSGVPMRSALLADRCGMCLPLMMWDAHAMEDYEQGEEVTIFPAVSQSGLLSDDHTNDRPGAWWIYTEAYILSMNSPAKQIPVTEITYPGGAGD